MEVCAYKRPMRLKAPHAGDSALTEFIERVVYGLKAGLRRHAYPGAEALPVLPTIGLFSGMKIKEGAEGQHGVQAAEGEGLRESNFDRLRRGPGWESRPDRIPDLAG